MLYEASAFDLGLVDFAQDPGCGRLDNGDDDVERRKLLKLLAGALAAPLVGPQKADADRLAYALSRPSGTDDAAAAAVEASIAAARRLDDVLGSRLR